MELEELLERIKTKDDPKSGVMVASAYLKQIFDCTDGICGVMPQDVAPIAEWQKAIGDADKILTYSADDLDIEVRGEEDKKFVPTPNAVMDFETVMTSVRKDRDGDILETKGAEPDLKMPYLFMHTYFHIGGKLCEITLHNSRRMKGHFALLDCPVGRDMAFLIENKALRSSIGFHPLEWEPLKENKDEPKTSWRNGYKYKRFAVVETSGVPVPSNEDAIITAYSRAKLFSPMAKLLGYSLRAKMPDKVPGGFDPEPEPEPIKTPACSCGGSGHKQPEPSPEPKEPTVDELATKLIGRLLKGEHPNPILVANLQETLTQEESFGTERVLAELLG